MATLSGATPLLRTFGGIAICDDLGAMVSDAATLHPTVAVIEFSRGMTRRPAWRVTRWRPRPTTRSIKLTPSRQSNIFWSNGIPVILIGSPVDVWPDLTAKINSLNAIVRVACGQQSRCFLRRRRPVRLVEWAIRQDPPLPPRRAVYGPFGNECGEVARRSAFLPGRKRLGGGRVRCVLVRCVQVRHGHARSRSGTVIDPWGPDSWGEWEILVRRVRVGADSGAGTSWAPCDAEMVLQHHTGRPVVPFVVTDNVHL